MEVALGTTTRPKKGDINLCCLGPREAVTSDFSPDSHWKRSSHSTFSDQDMKGNVPFMTNQPNDSCSTSCSGHRNRRGLAHPGRDITMPNEQIKNELSYFDTLTGHMAQFLTTSSAIKQWDETIAQHKAEQTQLNKMTLSDSLLNRFTGIVSSKTVESLESRTAAHQHQSLVTAFEKPFSLNIKEYWDILQVLFPYNEKSVAPTKVAVMTHHEDIAADIFLKGISKDEMSIFWAHIHDAFPKADDQKLILLNGISSPAITHVLIKMYSQQECTWNIQKRPVDKLKKTDETTLETHDEHLSNKIIKCGSSSLDSEGSIATRGSNAAPVMLPHAACPEIMPHVTHSEVASQQLKLDPENDMENYSPDDCVTNCTRSGLDRNATDFNETAPVNTWLAQNINSALENPSVDMKTSENASDNEPMQKRRRIRRGPLPVLDLTNMHKNGWSCCNALETKFNAKPTYTSFYTKKSSFSTPKKDQTAKSIRFAENNEIRWYFLFSETSEFLVHKDDPGCMPSEKPQLRTCPHQASPSIMLPKPWYSPPRSLMQATGGYSNLKRRPVKQVKEEDDLHSFDC